MITSLVTDIPSAFIGFIMRSSVLLLSVGVSAILLRRRSAAVRHLLWTVSILAVAVLPFGAVVGHPWRVALLPAHQIPAIAAPIDVSRPAVDSDVEDDPSLDAAPILSIVPHASPGSKMRMNHSTAIARQASIPARAEGMPLRDSIMVAACVAWGAGVLWMLASTGAGLAQVRRIRRRAAPVEGRLAAIADACRLMAGIGQASVLLSTDVDVPMTWGVGIGPLSPAVVLPVGAEEWSEGCVRGALLHEFAHVRRRDWLTQLLVQLVCSVYWFHPLLWQAASSARAESERACDDLAISMGVRPSDYAEGLVEVVRSMPTRGRVAAAAVAMARTTEIEGRLRDLLARGRDRRPVSRGLRIGIAAAVGCVAAAAGIVQPVSKSIAASHGTAAYKPSHFLQFVSLKDVGANGRYRLITSIDRAGGQRVSFTDTTSGVTFSDFPTIEGQFRTLLSQGSAKRPGASVYRVPRPLSALTGTEFVYFTPGQRAQAKELVRESNAWFRMMINDIVIATDADVLPNAAAIVSSTGRPLVRFQLSRNAGERMRIFTSKNQGSYLGILLDGRVLEAPVIMATLSDQGEIAEFASMGDAERLADRLDRRKRVTGSTPADVESWNVPAGRVTASADTRKVLANGYTVEVNALAQATPTGIEWNMRGGRSWSPDGTLLDNPIPAIGAATLDNKDGIAPYIVEMTVVPPDNAMRAVPNGVDAPSAGMFYRILPPHPAAAAPISSLGFGSREQVGTMVVPASFAPGTRSFNLLIGVAAGPWHTVASVPYTGPKAMPQPAGGVVVQMSDTPSIGTTDGHGGLQNVHPFIATDARLDNVDRRIVAVDRGGREIPVSMGGSRRIAATVLPYSQHPAQFDPNAGIDLSKITEFRLETRPYETIEFNNIHLLTMTPYAPMTAEQARVRSLELTSVGNMRLLAAAMGQYEMDRNEYRVPDLRTPVLMREKLAGYVEELSRPNRISSARFEDHTSDPFVSPITGKPYQFNDGLVGKQLTMEFWQADLIRDAPVADSSGRRRLVLMENMAAKFEPVQ